MDVDGSASMEAESKIAVPIAPSSVIVKGDANKKWLHLSGHSGEVFLCSWNPVEKQLASGSADGVCRLWNFVGVDKNKWESVDSQINIRSAILSHTVYSGQRFKDVTSLSWSPDGKTLVTGCYDGSVRFWDNQGALKHLSNEHSGPIFSLRWSKSGNYLLSGSHDRKALVWNPSTYAVIKTFTNHSLPVFDVDWLDDDLFATGSADKSIVISSVSTSDCKALYTFTGHESEINVVRFSPDGMMLASCSDDHTAKIWTMQNGMVQDLRGHTKEIYTCKWAMHGGKPLLCTASFDGTVKVWDAAHFEVILSAFPGSARVADAEGLTPLMRAVQMKNITLVRQILDVKKVAPDKKNSGGQTPLMVAASLQLFDICLMLVDMGASRTTQDHFGWNARQYAMNHGSHPSMVMLLNPKYKVPEHLLRRQQIDRGRRWHDSHPNGYEEE